MHVSLTNKQRLILGRKHNVIMEGEKMTALVRLYGPNSNIMNSSNSIYRV